ncbi:MAG: DUF2971 domain-containing protein [Chloroflexi bacterium]|nr:DUF2971 domain-containing protein [Chloroflexota bacterium]
MIPRELCHYTKKDTALEKILFKRQIRLGQLGLTNDPKESKWRSFAIIYPENYKPRDSYPFPESEEVYRISKEEWKVLCMTQHLPKRKYKSLMKNEIMPRFQHGWNRPRMWAQYADNHSGVCLIFDGKILHSNIVSSLKDRCKIFHGPVSYKNYNAAVTRPIDYSDIIDLGLTNGIRKFLFEHHNEYFLTKFPDWENESEYRWLLHSDSKSEEYVSIEGALKAVLVGSDFPKVYEPAIKEVCKGLGVSVGRMHWSNGIPSANFGEIFDPSK